MATVLRGPTYASLQRKPPQPTIFWVTGLITPALLLSGEVPFKSPTQQVVAQQHPSHALTANPDTSRGYPKTLYADAAKAFFNPPPFAPAAKGVAGYLNPDTSQGVPKVLYADARNAFANPPHKAPDRLWPVTDTTQDTPLTLLASLFVQPPFANPPSLRVDRLLFAYADTSQHAAPALYGAVAPFVNPPSLRVDRLLFAYDDTSQNASPALYAVAPVPFTNVPTWTAPLLLWKGLDSSAGTPKTLYADFATPAFNAPQFQADRLRPVADTSQGSPPILSVVFDAPFAQHDWPNAIEFRPQQYQTKWDWQLTPDYIIPAPDVVPVVDQGGGGGRKKKKKYVPLGDASEERERLLEAIVGQLHPVPEEPPPTDNRAALMNAREAELDKAAAQQIQDDDDLAFILSL